MPNLRSRRGSAARGFSLIEMLITITMVGLLSLIAVPRMAQITREQRVARAANSVSNDLQLAVALAQRDRKPIRIRWRSDSLMLTITNRAMTTTFRKLMIGGSSGFDLRSSQIAVYPTTGIVEVFPNGLATDSVSLQFTAGSGSSYSKRVRMTRAGLVQIF